MIKSQLIKNQILVWPNSILKKQYVPLWKCVESMRLYLTPITTPKNPHNRNKNPTLVKMARLRALSSHCCFCSSVLLASVMEKDKNFSNESQHSCVASFSGPFPRVTYSFASSKYLSGIIKKVWNPMPSRTSYHIISISGLKYEAYKTPRD